MKTKKKVNVMRACCDRFKNEEHDPECPQAQKAREPKKKPEKAHCKDCGRTDLEVQLNNRCTDCNEAAPVKVDLSLVFDLAPSAVSKPESIIECAIDYLQTVLDGERGNPEQLVKHLGLRVERIG